MHLQNETVEYTFGRDQYEGHSVCLNSFIWESNESTLTESLPSLKSVQTNTSHMMEIALNKVNHTSKS